VWEAANKPLVPEGRAEKEGKEYAESAPTLKESEHPYLTGAAKGLAGGYADTLGFVRGLTSPIGVAAMGLGALGKSRELWARSLSLHPASLREASALKAHSKLSKVHEHSQRGYHS